MHEELIVTSIQTSLIWENISGNLNHFEGIINSIKQKTDIIILPEMFSTGFTMKPEKFAQSMDGNTVNWMKEMSVKSKSLIIGSLIIHEDGKYYNRLIASFPDGVIKFYDKRHLFAMAGENLRYSAGNSKLIFEYEGWRICPLICYDLRFPVWARNCSDYDVLVYIANWPEKRNMHWKVLLQARAIENQAYVIGVNRIGVDGNNYNYTGDTSVFDPTGSKISKTEAYKESAETIILSRKVLEETRKSLPFLSDRDEFQLI